MTITLPIDATVIVRHTGDATVVDIPEDCRPAVAESLAGGRRFTPQEVRDWLNIGKDTLIEWEKKNMLVPIRAGGIIRYREADILEFEKHQTKEIRVVVG